MPNLRSLLHTPGLEDGPVEHRLGPDHLSQFFWSEIHVPHPLSTPCKYGPPRCSHLGGDSIRTTGFLVYIPQRLAALAFGKPMIFSIRRSSLVAKIMKSDCHIILYGVILSGELCTSNLKLLQSTSW